MTVIADATAVTIERRIFDAVLQKREPVIIVDSPPGAGKTYLTESIGALGAAHKGWRVALVTPKRDQAQDLALRLRRRFPVVRVEFLHSKATRIADEVIAAGIACHTRVCDLAPGPGVVVSTVDKLSSGLPDLASVGFDLVVIDEAYQTMLAQAAGVISAVPQIVLVGDPGQLDPFVEVSLDRFEEGRDLVHRSLPEELLRKFPGIPASD